MATDLNDEEEPNPAAGTSGRSGDYPLPADVGSSKGSDAPASDHPRRRKSTLVALLTGIFIGIVVAVIGPVAVRVTYSAWSNVASHLVGVDHPIELAPICVNRGGIMSPPAEDNAAFHWRCMDSRRPISRAQIEQRCKDEWGSAARLVLRDPNAAAGWTCHTRGLLH